MVLIVYHILKGVVLVRTWELDVLVLKSPDVCPQVENTSILVIHSRG